MVRQAAVLFGLVFSIQSFAAMSFVPLDQRLNRDKPVSPAKIIDETGQFIPISDTTTVAASDDQAREARFQTAVQQQDPMGVMDNGTPDEIAQVYGLPGEDDPRALLQNASFENAIVRINVDIAPRQQSLTVFIGGQRQLGPVAISSARPGYHTPIGCFSAKKLDQDHHSSKYFNAPMPWSIFFLGGYAVHGTTEVRELGRPASHGCVRVLPSNARQIYGYVQQYGLANSVVCVYDSSRRPAPQGFFSSL